MAREPEKWTILSSRYLIKKSWCTVRADHVRLPNGVEIPEYYVLEYPDWINVIAVTVEQDFIFVRQYRHGIGEVGCELVAGVIDDTDPTPLHAAQRELLEESGYGRGKWELLTVIAPNPGSQNNRCHCFLATGVEKIGEQNLEPTEDIEVITLKPAEVKRLLVEDRIEQALHAAPLWKYVALKKL